MISYRHLMKGSVLATIEQIARALAALVVTPVMVAHLGMADFGLWVLMSGVFSQFILLDPGLQSSLPRFLAQTDENRLRAIASTAHRLYLVVGAVGGAPVVIVWAVVPWFVGDAARVEMARSVAVLLGVSTVVGLVLKVPSLYLQSLLRRDVIAGVATARIIICSVLVVVLLTRCHRGLLAVAMVNCGGAVVEACLLAWFGRGLLPYMHRQWIDRAMVRTLLGYSKWAYLISNCERLRMGLDAFVLGWLRGSPAAGTYSLGARPVWMAADTLYACIGTQLLPAFSKLQHHDEKDRLGAVFVVITRLAAWMSMSAACMVLLIGPTFLQWWVPQHAAAAMPVLLCLALPSALQLAQVPAVHLLYALAEHRSLALVQTAGLLLNLALSICFARWYGIVGAALGTAVEILVVHGLVMPILISRKASIAPVVFLWRSQLVPLLVCGAVFAVPFVVMHYLPLAPVVSGLVLAGLLTSAWAGAIAWMLKIGRSELSELKRLLS